MMPNQKGDIVMVYEDPVTEQKPEGKAELLKLIIPGTDQEYWKVRFIDDGTIVWRWIKPREEA